MQRLHRSMPATRRRAQGFTLVEMVISALLLGFLAVTATFFWVHNLTLVRTVNTDTSTLADARAVLERLAREIREVKYGTWTDSAGNTTSGYCLNTMTGTTIAFNKSIVSAYDITCGLATPGTTNNDFAVKVFVDGSTLKLGYSGSNAKPVAESALAGDVGNFSIKYLDANYVVLQPALTDLQRRSAVRYIELSLTLAPAGVQSTVARTLIALRNT